MIVLDDEILNYGRLGNKLNFLSTGYLIHKITGIKFQPTRIDGFVNTYNAFEGKTVDKKKTKLSTLFSWDIEVFKNNLLNHDGSISIDLMIPSWSHYKCIDDQFKMLYETDQDNIVDNSDGEDCLSIHIRLGDYIWLNMVADPSVYYKSINDSNWSKITIVTDDINSPYLNTFKKDERVIIRSSDVISDFVYLKKSKNICNSRSSYSWCASLASDAKTVYMPLSDVKDYSLNFQVDRKSWKII